MRVPSLSYGSQLKLDSSKMKKSAAKMLGRGPARGRPKPMAPLPSAPLAVRREVVQRFVPVVESGAAEVEESFQLRPPSPGRKMAFAMTMKMSAKLMEVLLQAEQNGVQPEIKFGMANVIKVGDMEFKLTSNPEAGSGLCDCYMDEQQTSNGAEGALIHVGSVDRKLSVQRLLDDTERERWKGRSEAVDKSQKGRKVMVFDPKNPGLDGSSQSQNNKKRKPTFLSGVPPATRPKVTPINKPISRPIPPSRPPPAPAVTLSQTQKTTREALPPVVPVATPPPPPPPPPPPVVTLTPTPVSIPALPPRIGGKEKVVSPTSDANSPAENGAPQGKTSSSQAPINLTELRLTIIRILKQNPKGMKPKALEKAVGREFHQMERTLKQIAEYKAPGLWRLQSSIPTPPSVGTSSPDSLVESPPTLPEPANAQEHNGKPTGVADLSNNVAKLPSSRNNSGATHPLKGGHDTKASPKGQEQNAGRSESQSLGDRQKTSFAENKTGHDSKGGRVLLSGQGQENAEHHPPNERVKPGGVEVNEKLKTVRTSNKRQNSETQLKSPEQSSKALDTTVEGNAGQEESGDESASSGGSASDSESESGSESGSESSGTSGSDSESEGSSSSSGEEDEESVDIDIDSDGEAKVPMLASDGTDVKLTQENKAELKLSRSESKDGRTGESGGRESKREKKDGERSQHKHKDHKDSSSKVEKLEPEEELHLVDGLKDRGAAVASGFETIDIGVEEEVDVDDGVEDSSIPGAVKEASGVNKSEVKELAQNVGGSSVRKAEKESNREKRRAERALNERPEKREKIDQGDLTGEPMERIEKAKTVKMPKKERGEKGERELKRKERHGTQDVENTRLLKGDEAGIVDEEIDLFGTREGVDIVDSVNEGEAALDEMGETLSISSGPTALEKGESHQNETTAVNHDDPRQELLDGKTTFSPRVEDSTVEEHIPFSQAKATLGEGERVPKSGPIVEAQRTEAGKAAEQLSSYEHQSDKGEDEEDEEREEGELEADEEAEIGQDMDDVNDGEGKTEWETGELEGRKNQEELCGNENPQEVEIEQHDEQGSQKVNQTFVEEKKRPNETDMEWERGAEHERTLDKEERKQIEKQMLEQDEIERKDRERREKERIERDRKERDRMEKERIERDRLEKERIERDRLEKERIERELEKERREAERKAKERMAREVEENERKDRERKAKEREEKEKMEKERIERDRLEKERIEKETRERNEEKERIEKERKEREGQERLRKEREREEKLRKERERVEKERIEREMKEKEREEREQKLREKKEKERQEREKREKDREDRERQAREREEKEQKEREEKEQKEQKEKAKLIQRSRREQEKTKERAKRGGHGTDGRSKVGFSAEIGDQEDLDADQEGSGGRRFSQAKGAERALKARGTEEDSKATMEKERVITQSSKNYQVSHEVDRSSSEAGEDEERVKKSQMGNTVVVKRVGGEEASRVLENFGKRKYTGDVGKLANWKQSPAGMGTGSRHTSPLPPIARTGSLTSQSVGSPSEGGELKQTPVRREKVRSINDVVRRDDRVDGASKVVSRNKDVSPLKERSNAPKQENVGGRETRDGRAEVGGSRHAEIQTSVVTGSGKSGQRGNSTEMTQASDEGENGIEGNAHALHETSPKVVVSNPNFDVIGNRGKADGPLRKPGSQAGEYAGSKPMKKGPVFNGGNKEGGPLGTAKNEEALPVIQGWKMNGQKRPKDDFFAKFEKEKAELRGPLNSIEQCLEYEKEFHEKFRVYKLLNDVLETDRDDFLAIKKGLQKEEDEEERKIIHAKLKKKYKQMNPRHTRMLAVFTVLHTELQVIKRRITDFVQTHDRT